MGADVMSDVMQFKVGDIVKALDLGYFRNKVLQILVVIPELQGYIVCLHNQTLAITGFIEEKEVRTYEINT
jgi:hypothetical protein